MSQIDQAVPRAGLNIPDSPRLFGVARGLQPRWRLALAWLEAQSLFVAGVAVVAIVSLATIPLHLNQDGWLALVGGRYIATHGVPSADTLNILTHGVRWLDQQWLAQLVLYRVAQLGGLFLYGVVYVTLATAGLGLAIAGARSLRGTERAMLWVLIPATSLYIVGSFPIRTQGFAYPLFAGVLWLLAKEARDPSRRRVYSVLPLLVVWANLHGSVTLGVGLAVIYGITLLVEDLRSGGARRLRRRTVIFLLVPAACLVATPYGFSIFSYYHETLLNPTFSQLITEWRPVTSAMVIAVPCLGIAAATIWLLGRSGRRTPLFDHLALIMLAAGAIFAIRNISWFGLGTAMLLPACLAGLVKESRATPRRSTLNLTIASVSLVALTGAVIVLAVRPASWYERTYDARTLAGVQAIARQQPHAKIFADVRYADWLLWHDPALAGRLAYDTRLELLTRRQLEAISGLGEIIAPHDFNILAPFDALVLDQSNAYTKVLLSRPGVHVRSRNSDAVVAQTGRR